MGALRTWVLLALLLAALPLAMSGLDIRGCHGYLPGNCHVGSSKMAMMCNAIHPVYCQYLDAPMWGLGCARPRLCDELCSKAERIGGSCTPGSRNLTAVVDCFSDGKVLVTVQGKHIKFPHASSFRGATVYCHHKATIEKGIVQQH